LVFQRIYAIVKATQFLTGLSREAISLKAAGQEERVAPIPISPSLDYLRAVPLPARGDPLIDGDFRTDPPSKAFFTRATWRAGKHGKMRKRVNPYAGQMTAPAAFLEAGKRNAFKPGRPGYRVCSATTRDGNPCGMLALKGLKVCGAHGGYSLLAKQGKFQPSGTTAAFNAARVKVVEGNAPPAPPELINLPLYRQANQWARIRLIRAWGTPAWIAIVRQCRT